MKYRAKKMHAVLIAFAMVASLLALAACAAESQDSSVSLDAATEQEPEASYISEGVASDDAIEIQNETEVSGDADSATYPSATQSGGPAASRAAEDVPATAAHTTGAGQAQGTSQAVVQPVQVHSHDWRPVTEPREIVDVEAWEETSYKTVECTVCSVCGEDVTNGDSLGRSILEHGKAHALAGQGGGTHSSTKRVPNGVVKHPAQTHTEHVTVKWRCAGCGAEKAA